MAAKKKTTKPYGNKTKFVMGLPRELSAKQVVEKAKQQGITITEAHVYKIRSTAKSKPAAKPAKGGRSSGKAAASVGSDGLSKREFVLSFGPETPASEILKKAKEAGLGLSKAYLYTIRSSSGATQKRGASAGRAAGARRGSVSSLESQFIDAAIDMGLAKAGELLERLRARLKEGL
ncbi:MAG: hypothetical protein QM778_13440 [Myxococcales bacterium]